MPRYQFSIQFGDQLSSPFKTVELADRGKACAAGKQVVEAVLTRLKGNAQLAIATLIVTDTWGSLICELPFSDDFELTLGSLNLPH
jgi:hypothetical protein